MLILSEGDGADWGTTVLHKEVLYDHSSYKDQKEKGIVEETAEYVELLFTELASVDLVEDLHAHKGLEDYRVVGQFFPFVDRSAKVWIKFASWVIFVCASRVAESFFVATLFAVFISEAE